MSVACWKLGAREEARKWYIAALVWTEKHYPNHEELLGLLRGQVGDVQPADPDLARTARSPPLVVTGAGHDSQLLDPEPGLGVAADLERSPERHAPTYAGALDDLQGQVGHGRLPITAKERRAIVTRSARFRDRRADPACGWPSASASRCLSPVTGTA